MITLPEALDEGRIEPMGALARDGGANFVVFSEHARAVELCIFDDAGTTELRRLPLHGPHDGLFHGFLPGAGPGLVYGLRAHGPYQPESGHLFNANKLLLDPWAREIVGRFEWRPEHHGHAIGHPDGHRSFDTRDNAATALKARVAPPPSFAPGWHNAPRIAPADMVLYEVHVKGFSQLHPRVPPELRGTYAGLAHPASIAHFKLLGVTTLSLLPVHHHLDEEGLAERGLTNYWGYNSIGVFSPDPRLASRRDDPTAVTQEFRAMVAALHDAGLEVVLDVVYNHTAEGSETGGTIAWRGLDHACWYRLQHDRQHCDNTTGCGNTVAIAHPRTTQWVLDSLRYWVQEMGVDGFRFDLATVLGRTPTGYSPQAAFFTALRQDPVLARAHLIAEPWDAGHDGYQVGRFPGRFLEWNDKFRDSVRRYWLGKEDGARVGRGEFARRFTASNDLFHHGQRRPSASVNFVTAHDGFTLADVVSYRTKHNEANGEGNRDGRDGEPCADFGVEGPTDEPAINAVRLRVKRAMLATLLLAQGTPMLTAGDEIGKTQGGNNNPWCQDNEIGWLDWERADQLLLDFVAEVVALRRSEPALRHDNWFEARRGHCTLRWLAPAGHDMQMQDWHDGHLRAFACVFECLREGRTSPLRPPLWLAFNPEASDHPFALPPGTWQLAIDSSGELPRMPAAQLRNALIVPRRSLVALRQLRPADAPATRA
jgi:glycogen operon protein